MPSGIGTWVRNRRTKSARQPAILFSGEVQTYDALSDRIDRLASGLSSQGIAKGDRVAYLGSNHPSLIETMLASALLGAVFVPLNTRLTEIEISYQLEHSSARMLILSPEHRATGEAAAKTAGVRDVVPLAEEYERLLHNGRAPAPVEVDLHDPAVIIYTSGTTGHPKGAVLTHGNLTWNALNVIVDYDVTSKTRALMISPLFHAAALGMGALPTLLKGGLLLLEERFDPSQALRAIEEHRVTSLSGVPTTFQLLMEDPTWDATDLSSLQSLTCGGSAVPSRVRDEYERRGLQFSSGYGLTESSPGVTCLPSQYSSTHGQSSGLAHFFTEVRIGESAHDAAGEIEVRGPNVFSGYWQDPIATSSAFTDDGWLRTGDVGIIDEAGFLTIVGRSKDMIISGGENIYCAEVEHAILTIPGVTGAAVIGVPHERWGEVPHALVTLEPGARLDRDWFVEQLSSTLARYKVPRTVDVLEDLPRTATGKVRKHVLLAQVLNGQAPNL